MCEQSFYKLLLGFVFLFIILACVDARSDDFVECVHERNEQVGMISPSQGLDRICLRLTFLLYFVWSLCTESSKIKMQQEVNGRVDNSTNHSEFTSTMTALWCSKYTADDLLCVTSIIPVFLNLFRLTTFQRNRLQVCIYHMTSWFILSASSNYIASYVNSGLKAD